VSFVPIKTFSSGPKDSFGENKSGLNLPGFKKPVPRRSRRDRARCRQKTSFLRKKTKDKRKEKKSPQIFTRKTGLSTRFSLIVYYFGESLVLGMDFEA
jgi:hypothetical protein